ncbi:MAG: CPBP family intramembrane metalloprotease [Caldilineaceae bacterium]|nr:CPBP family intramembrane metalloprotease [Caldilineaceae bacterium]
MPFSYIAFAVLTLLLVGLVGYGTYRAAQILPDWPIDQNPLLHPAETALRLVLIILCIGLGLLSGQSRAVLGWQMPQPLTQVAWGILWGLVIAAVYIVATRWVMAKSGGRYYTTTVVRVIVPRSRRQLWAVAWAMISVVLLEELLFRSLLLGGFTTLLPTWLLLTAGGIIFGLMHSPQGWWGMVAIALGGVLLGLMFLAMQSLLMPLVAHYVANMGQIGYAYWRGVPELSDITPNR